MAQSDIIPIPQDAGTIPAQAPSTAGSDVVTIPQDALTIKPRSRMSDTLTGIGQSLSGTYETLKAPAVALLTPPRDMREHYVSMAGPIALSAYRASRSVVDSVEGLLKAKPEQFMAAYEQYKNALDAFARHDYRGAATSAFEALGHGMSVNEILPEVGLGERVSELAHGSRPGENLATPLAKDITDFVTFLAAEKAPKVVGKAGELFEKRATTIANGLLRAKTERSFLYDKDPGRALLDPKLINPTWNLEELWQNLDQVGALYDKQLRTILHQARGLFIDIVPEVNRIIDRAKNDLNNISGFSKPGQREGIVAHLETLRSDLLDLHDQATGKSVGRAVKTRLSPEDTLDKRRGLQKTTSWDNNAAETDPAVTEFVNNTKKALYANLNEQIENTVARGLVNIRKATGGIADTVKELNKKYSENIEARRLLLRRIYAEEKGDVGAANLLKNSELKIGALSLLTGHWIEGIGLVADRVIRSPWGRLIRAQNYYKAGRAIQNVAPATKLLTVPVAAGALSNKPDDQGGGGGY